MNGLNVMNDINVVKLDWIEERSVITIGLELGWPTSSLTNIGKFTKLIVIYDKGGFMAVRRISGQDETGRYYGSITEKNKASGRTIHLYLLLKREQEELGTVLSRVRWIYGGINFAHMGPKKWTRYLENNLDEILSKAMTYYRRHDKSCELLAIEGWEIIEPRKILNTRNMYLIDAE